MSAANQPPAAGRRSGAEPPIKEPPIKEPPIKEPAVERSAREAP